MQESDHKGARQVVGAEGAARAARSGVMEVAEQESLKTQERLLVLLEMVEGMQARLALVRRTLHGPQRPKCLQNSDWAKLRTTLEKSFPELPDTTKLKGYESFDAAAKATLGELCVTYETLVEVLEVKTASLALLRTLAPAAATVKLGLGRPLLLDVMALFVGVCRLQLMRSSLRDDVRVLISVFACAHRAAHGTGEGRFLALAKDDETFNVNPTAFRGLAETFKDLSTVVAAIVPQLAESIAATSDLANLRQRGALNPLGARARARERRPAQCAVVDHPPSLPLAPHPRARVQTRA